jgi:hypothetical protein
MSDTGGLAAAGTRPGLDSEIVAGARRLLLDAAAAQAITAFRARGIRSILMKGPATERWLYPEGVKRRYGDVDLLVAPGEFEAAAAELIDLRYRMQLPDRWLGVGVAELSLHAVEFKREGRGAADIDLHRTIHWARVDPELVWAELGAQTERMTVAGVDVEVLGPTAQAVIVALHAVQHGHDVPKPLDDLRRAVELVDQSVWRDAAEIAGRLGASAPFAAGLRMIPAGATVADGLELTRSEPAEVRLLRDGDALIALALEQFLGERSARARVRMAWAKLLPSPDYIRMGYPIARAGTVGLVRGYIQRWVRLVRRSPAALAAWRRARG